MKKTLLPLLLLSTTSFAWARIPNVMIIADRPLSVPYVPDDTWSSPGSVGLSWNALGFYCGECFQVPSTFTSPELAGYEFLGWHSFSKSVGYDGTSVENCSALLSSDPAITSATYKKSAKTSSSLYDDYVLCPKYEAKPLTVTFNGNGATSGSMSDVTGKTIDSAFALPKNAFAWTGHSFGGWTNLTGTAFSDGQSVTGTNFWNATSQSFDAALVAMWNVTSYTVTFDANGGSTPSPSTKSVTYGSAYGDLPTVTWSGRTFGGWWTERDGGTRIESSTKVSAADNHNLYAHWTVDRHSVTVSSVGNGTVSKEPDADSYTYGTDVRLSAAADEGYAFAAWSDGSTEPNRTVTIVSNASYRATFTNRVYTITFNAMEGTCDVKSKSVVYRGYIGEMPTPVQFHKTFAGWFTDQVGGTQVSQLNTYGWTIDITLYAHYAQAETFDVGADIQPNPVCGTVEGVGPYVSGDQVNLTAKPGSGYGFKDWNDGNVSPVTNFIASGGLRLTAVFTANVYTVTFRSSEGSPREQAKTVTFGEAYGDFPIVSADEDRKFEGWYTKTSGGGVRVTPETKVTIADNHDLFANWESIPVYWISYYGKDATEGSMADQKASCGADVQLASNRYVRTGHVFLGWSTNALAQTVDYADGAIVRDLAPQGMTCTLYPVWRLLTISEAMHAIGGLDWRSIPFKNGEDIAWQTIAGADAGFQSSGSCVRQNCSEKIPHLLSAAISENGQLSFRWKGEIDNARLMFGVNSSSNDVSGMNLEIEGGKDWALFTTNIVCHELMWIHIYNLSEADSVEIDQMTWTPIGVQYADVDTPVEQFRFDGGKVAFEFLNESGSASSYHLLGTNDLVAPMPWPVVFETNASPGFINFDIPVNENEPKMFYRIRALK